MTNLIQFSETSIFKSFKIMVVVAFALGGWFTTMQLNQLRIDERSIENQNKIEQIESNYNSSNLKTLQELYDIKSTLNEISLNLKNSEEKIKELKKK